MTPSPLPCCLLCQGPLPAGGRGVCLTCRGAAETTQRDSESHPPGAPAEEARLAPQAQARSSSPPERGGAPSPPVRWEGSARIGDFELLRELGRGGMGAVYLARHHHLGRDVAIKLLLEGSYATPHARRRFHAEAQAVARLRHPNIVGIHLIHEEQGIPYLVMDFIPGESLDARLARQGPLEEREAARITERLALALVHAHSQGVLHRDLKPANVLLTPEGQPILTDFGLAKRLDVSQGITATGQVVGTIAYMPPEQALGKIDQLDGRSDIYSLGATLYALLCGGPPFLSHNPVHAICTIFPLQWQKPSGQGQDLICTMCGGC